MPLVWNGYVAHVWWFIIFLVWKFKFKLSYSGFQLFFSLSDESQISISILKFNCLNCGALGQKFHRPELLTSKLFGRHFKYIEAKKNVSYYFIILICTYKWFIWPHLCHYQSINKYLLKSLVIVLNLFDLRLPVFW